MKKLLYVITHYQLSHGWLVSVISLHNVSASLECLTSTCGHLLKCEEDLRHCPVLLDMNILMGPVPGP